MYTHAKSIFALCALGATASSYAGFYVSGGDLYDGNGNKFIMRGVNHAHAWYTSQLDTAMSGIASKGANTVRVVLSNGHRWSYNGANEIADIIAKAKANNLVAVLEVHDTTGYGEDSAAASLSSAVDYWISMKNELVGQEDYVIINIGNEPFGNGQAASDWINGHKTAIGRMRSAGFSHTLMVDAPNWGQDWQNVMRDNAQTVFNSDPQSNTLFSVHMYEVYNSYSKVNGYMTTFANNGLALVIGEFSADHKGHDVDEASIMERAQTLGVGYLGWSWSGNDASTATLDIVNGWNANSLSAWGNTLLNGTNGISNTSVLSTIYTGGTTEYPVCSSSAADPDGDGWGWENNQSCIVASTAPNGFPYCSSASVDPDGDGWGWENSASCVVKGSAADH